MLGREKSVERGDPSVGVVEAILDRVATRVAVITPGRLPVAEHALWLCACVSVDDAPLWLLYDEPDGTFGGAGYRTVQG